MCVLGIVYWLLSLRRLYWPNLLWLKNWGINFGDIIKKIKLLISSLLMEIGRRLEEIRWVALAIRQRLEEISILWLYLLLVLLLLLLQL